MSDTNDLLDHQIGRLGATVLCPGGVVGEISARQRRAVRARRCSSGGVEPWHSVTNASNRRAASAGVSAAYIHRQRLVGQQGVEHLVEGIAGGQADLEAVPAVLAMAFDPPQQQAPDPIEGGMRLTPGKPEKAPRMEAV